MSPLCHGIWDVTMRIVGSEKNPAYNFPFLVSLRCRSFLLPQPLSPHKFYRIWESNSSNAKIKGIWMAVAILLDLVTLAHGPWVQGWESVCRVRRPLSHIVTYVAT